MPLLFRMLPRGLCARSFPLLAFVFFAAAARATDGRVQIREAVYEERPHLVVEAGGVTWYYDRAGGGFSRLIDREGRDWIAFRMQPDSGPGGAAGKFRGLPNMVYGPGYPESGAGHPGFDHCTTERVGADVLRTASRSGKWAWQWRFTIDRAVFTLERSDPDQPWWFIYEGPIGGRFQPAQTFWGTDTGGPRREARNYKLNEEVAEAWRWAYFGLDGVSRVLAIAGLDAAPMPGVLGYLGATPAGLDAPDGMVVFGFGRDRSRPFRPLFRESSRSFVVALIEDAPRDAAGHRTLGTQIERLVRTSR